MADKSLIEWTDSTWNVVTGCTLVSSGCKFCYAATLAAGRLRNHPSRAGLARINAAGEAKFTGEVRINEQWLDQPLRWSKPRRIFVCAHGDLFHEAVPDEWIDRVFAVMALAPQHVFQVLTKRPERAREYLADGEVRLLAWCRDNLEAIASGYAGLGEALNQRLAAGGFLRATDADIVPAIERRELAAGWPLPNVWLGTSVEDQATADERVPHLLAAPAAVRFLSAEPLLGPVDLEQWLHDSHCWEFPGTCICSEPREVSLDWIIVGGESGNGARPANPQWFRDVRDQCRAAGVAFFHKQNGEWASVSEIAGPGAHFTFPDGRTVRRVGKKAAGRLLDGREHNEVPHG